METDDTGAVEAVYNYGYGLISRTKVLGLGSEVLYYNYDGLGTTRQLTDSLEAVTVSYMYDSFGNLLASSGTSSNPYGFTGQQQFAEADNLVFLRARYYAPQIGRFISRDPILTPIQIQGYVKWLLPYLNLIYEPQTLHPYVYVQNNPVNFVDPTGLYTACFEACDDNLGNLNCTLAGRKCIECCQERLGSWSDPSQQRRMGAICAAESSRHIISPPLIGPKPKPTGLDHIFLSLIIFFSMYFYCYFSHKYYKLKKT